MDFELLDADDNVITFGDFEEVPPGTSYRALVGGPLVLKLRNASGVAKTNRRLSVAQRPGFVLHNYVTLSLDGVTFGTAPIDLGPFAAGQAKTFYADLVVPVGAPGGSNGRCDLNVWAVTP